MEGRPEGAVPVSPIPPPVIDKLVGNGGLLSGVEVVVQRESANHPAAREAAAREAASRAAGSEEAAEGEAAARVVAMEAVHGAQGAWDCMWGLVRPLRACKSLCERSSSMSFICEV